MTVRTSLNQKPEHASAKRGGGETAALRVAAAVIFAIALVAPITTSLDTGFTANKAHAGGGNGGGNSGGNGGGNGGGNSGGNGSGNGNNGGGTGGKSTAGVDVPSVEAGRDSLLLPPPPRAEITMAMFTTRISKRYPADDISTYDNPHLSISFFSEFQGMSGKEITHRWIHGGNVKFQALFKIRANHWRVWSTQLLPVDMPGEWTVEVADKEGKVLAVHQLNYVPVGTAIAAK